MSVYEARLERDLGRIREKLAELSGAVHTAMETATRALFSGSREASYGVCLGDHPINRASRALDRTCLGFIAVHLPSAGHLRYVSAAMHTNVELERIGDYAKTISRESVQLVARPSGAICELLEHVSRDALATLAKAIAASNDRDADAAEAGIRMATDARHRVSAGFSHLMAEEVPAPIHEILCYLVILNCFDRVVDQSKNICEETVFALTGQTKAPKAYRVLFLDEDNSVLGPMARALARRNHPLSGVYDTAGRQAAEEFRGGLAAFLEERGVEWGDAAPQTLDPAADLGDYHVIVSLQGSVRDYLDKIPFATIALDWDVEVPPAGGGTGHFEALYRALAPRLRDLMVTLHGEESS